MQFVTFFSSTFTLSFLQMIIAGFSGNTDLSRAQEIANEVRRVVKNLKECQTLSQLYNQRERLFDAPVTSVCSSNTFDNVCNNLYFL